MNRAPYEIDLGSERIRAYSPTDVNLAFEVMRGELEWLQQYMPWAHNAPQNREELLELLLTFRGEHDLGVNFTFGVFAEDGRYVGGCGLHPRVGPSAFEIGYWVKESCTGKGIGSRCCAALTRVAFELMDAKRVELHIEPSNTASRRIASKLRFEEEGLRRARLPFNDELRDSIAYVMLDAEYPSSPARAHPITARDALGTELLGQREDVANRG